MGARLVAGEQAEVTLIDRGERLEALRDGLALTGEDGETRRLTGYRATGDFDEPGPQDVVVLATKAHEIEQVAPRMPALFGEKTVVVTVQNGIPWWYFQRYAGPFEGRRLSSLDESGTIEAHLPADRVIGCIAYPAAIVERPGVVRHVEGNYFPIGELDGSASPRLERVAGLLSGCGFKTRLLTDLRAEIWLKAWGNLSFNPISALTGATMRDIARLPESRELARAMMAEAKLICDRLGVTVRKTIEERIAGAEKVGAHKTSMLQDVEAGLPLEHEALIGAVQELGRWTEVATPAIDGVAACIRLLDQRLRAEGAVSA
jgi:2-dehydropantoate 2-reductase